MNRRDPVRVLTVLDGRATWEQLSSLCTRYAVDQAVARRQILRTRRGLYVLPDLPDARAAAAALGGVLSHVSAAVELGLPVLVAPSQVHVTVPSGDAVRPPPGVVLHRSDLPPPDRRLVATRPLRTVVDCALSLPFAEALAVADSALREGLIGMDDLRWAGAERRGPGRKRLLRVTEAANDLAANPFESALRATVLEAGATRFRPQCAVRLTNGRIVHVDLGDPDLEVALEADSYAHHGSRHALREDCRRYDELIRAGWLVLRFAWEHVILDARWVADTVLDTCALRSPDRCAPPLRRRNGPLRAGR